MRLRATLVLIAAGVPTAAARADCPTEYELVIIAEEDGELGLVDPRFGTTRALPSINAAGEVAFTGWVGTGGRAVYVGDGDRLEARARDRQVDPASGWTQLDDAQMAPDGVVAFSGVRDEGSPGAWIPAIAEVTRSGAERVVAIGGDDGRWAGVLPAFDVDADGTIVFGASLGPGRQVIASSAGTIVDGGEWDVGEPRVGAGNSVVFFASRNGAERGLYRGLGDPIALDDERGLGVTSVSMGPSDLVAFVRAYPDPDRPGYSALRIERYTPGGLAPVVLADSASGEWGLHAARNRVSLLDQSRIGRTGAAATWTGCVVWNAQVPALDALLIADEDGMHRIVVEGEPQLGGVVSVVDMSEHAVNERGQIAFYLELGIGRRLIVRADPIDSSAGGCEAGGGTAPGAVVVLVALGLALRRRGARAALSR